MRFTHPNKAISKVFSIIFAPSLTSNTTAIKTNANERTGSHFAFISEWLLNQAATNVESFNAAARPIINATTEKTAIINPF